MKVYLETLGCQMNRLDSELVLGDLVATGAEVVNDPRDADAVIYNTCSVRRQAEQKVLSRIGAIAQRKASGKRQVLAILGCMAQRMGEDLRRRHPEVDLVVGPGQLYRLGELLREAWDHRAPAVALDRRRPEPPDLDAEAGMDRLDLSRETATCPTRSQAFVRVMRGCDNFCTYCIVPYVRGAERSRDPHHVAEEVARLVDSGRTEITLLGQAVNRWRWDADGRSLRFGDLLARLADTPGLRRLRFVTSHPCEFTNDVLEAMRDLPPVCEYIHCPAQSGSDRMLEAMNRGYTAADYDRLLARACELVPDVTLAGDFIVGFPGETEADHAASTELIRRAGYKNSFVFKYSPRPGTFAAKQLPDDVPAEIKKRRNRELLAIQEDVGLAHHRGRIGRIEEVLVEGPSPRAGKQRRDLPAGHTQLIGRTRGDHIVVFDGPGTLADEYIRVEITDATSVTLFGKRSEGDD